jgi:hypothetical protein
MQRSHTCHQPLPALVLQVYWVDLDYLEVAAVAIQCRATFTALLYVEAWCEAKYGRLKLGGSAPGGAVAASGGGRRQPRGGLWDGRANETKEDPNSAERQVVEHIHGAKRQKCGH